jgi:hypothetical protein
MEKALIIIFLLLSFLSCKNESCQEYESSAKKLHYDIFVTDRGNEGRRFEILGKDTLGKKAEYTGVSGMYIDIIDSLSIGDRIKKDTGSLIVTIYKPNRKIYFYYVGCKSDGKTFEMKGAEVEYLARD